MEEPVAAKPELEKVGPNRILPALPAVTDEQYTQIQAFGMDITKEDNGQLKMAPHESPPTSQSSSGEGEGESTPEEAPEHTEPETTEPPLSLTDLLG